VQRQVIPCLLDGESVVALAGPGAGKTLSYILPMVDMLEYSTKGGLVSWKDRFGSSKRMIRPSGLIIVPTRELVDQVHRVLETYKFRLSIGFVFGGMESVDHQESRLVSSSVDILIGTPGRLMDLMKRGSLSVQRYSFIITCHPPTHRPTHSLTHSLSLSLSHDFSL
jgi:superfamily II DNA/RNA helicase